MKRARVFGYCSVTYQTGGIIFGIVSRESSAQNVDNDDDGEIKF